MSKKQVSHPHHQPSFTSHKGRYECYWCKMPIKGKRHKCNGYDYHNVCWKHEETLISEAYPGCTFRFLPHPLQGINSTEKNSSLKCKVCDICTMPVKGFVYHCPEKKIDIHPLCAMLKRTIQVDDLMFVLCKGAVRSKCSCCKTEEDIPCFWYESQCKKYRFRLSCLMTSRAKYRPNSTVGGFHRQRSCKVRTTNNLGYQRLKSKKKKRLHKNPGRGSIAAIGHAVGLFADFISVLSTLVSGFPAS